MSDLCPLGADEQLIPVQRSRLFRDWGFMPIHPKDKACRQKQRNDVYAAHCSEECTDLCIGEKKPTALQAHGSTQHPPFAFNSPVASSFDLY